MRQAIIATWHHYPKDRTPLQTLLHRADIANIGGNTPEFINSTRLLWRESLRSSSHLSWEQYIAHATVFINEIIIEHDAETRSHGIDTNDITLDVNNTIYCISAVQNIATLSSMHRPDPC